MNAPAPFERDQRAGLRELMTMWNHKLSKEEVLRELESSARARWDEERLAAQGPALSATANALWLLSQQELALLEEAPDFSGGVAAQDA